MKSISKECDKNINVNVFSDVEKVYSVILREDIKAFLIENSGGYPVKDIIVSDGDDYEVRVFLSLDDANEYYSIKKPLAYFMKNTNGKIVPIGIDSGDNYYCVNNETGKVYYWCADSNSYYLIADSLEAFTDLF